jgi:xanthine dehydrogenase YagS FAD-binding subunit
MEAFAYAHPATKQEALGMLGANWEDAAVLAGGTDLISCMKEHIIIPKRVISIRGVAEWKEFTSVHTQTRIGALVTIEELRESAAIRKQFTALTHAADGITSPQLRNMGTVGGDLCQRPRCWYYRNGFGLLARDSKGNSLVPDGENRFHAIFGNDGPAYFVSPSSLGPALIALGGRLTLTSPSGDREVAAADFFRIPKSDSERENILKPNEILTSISLQSGAVRSATYEVRQKQAMDWPLATASVAVNLEGGKVRDAKIVLGHVAPVPWVADGAAKSLIGKSITEATASAAGDSAVQGARPLSQNGYKIQLARVCVKRALLAAAKEGA